MWVLIILTGTLAALLYRWQRSGQPLVHFLGLGLVRIYAKLWHRWSSNGRAPLPRSGPVILVANHTCSADPAFLTAGCDRPIGFLLAQEYYLIPVFRPLFDYIGCVPMSRDGRDAQGIRVALRRLSEGCALGIFPEGDLSNAGRARLRAGKAGIAWLALRSRAPVFPALITGGPQTPDVPEAWLRPSRVHVTFGPAIDLSAYYGRPIDRKLLVEVTALVMNRVAGLASLAARRSAPLSSRG